MVVRIQSDAFDIGVELAEFSATGPEVGALVSFTGLVRDISGGLQFMQIEHYPAMTQPAIERIEAEAVARWSLSRCLVIHRFGQLAPGEQIMMVATAAPHRVAAFEAAEFLMDYLKSRAPFWKKEITRSGAQWVAAKDEDEDALERWTPKAL
jgi:molybdopterin synthase catalytic subunit